MPGETTSVDVSASVAKVVNMPTDIPSGLVDLLVGVGIGITWRLSMVIDKIAHVSPLEELSAVLTVVGETAPTRPIGSMGSWRGRSAIRAHGVRGCLIMANIIDLAMRCLYHCGDHGDLRRLWQSAELIGGDGEVSARSLIDLVVSNAHEFDVQIAA